MHSRIAEVFANLRRANKKALIPYITAGDPSLETTGRLTLGMAAKGADIIELGLPFSDPVADGPVIQQSAERSLKGGTTPAGVFQLIEKVRLDSNVPIIILTYYNPVLRMGLKNFAARCAALKIDGLVIPDLPHEESLPLKKVSGSIDIISFLSPISSPERIAKLTRKASGFIYCVSVTGVTGARQEISQEAKEMLANIKKYTSLPLALGFGISTPEQAREAGRYADAVIVGSTLVKKAAKIRSEGDIKSFLDYFSSFRKAVDEVEL